MNRCEGLPDVGDAYALSGVLGEGAWGRVYSGRRVADGRPVAIKLLKEPLGPESPRRARFVREFELGRRVRSPHVVEQLELFASETLSFIVMEWIRGPSLQQALFLRGRLPLAEALCLGVDVAAALQAAASVGVVHRDVKPANVLLSEDGLAKLTDFGISKDLEQVRASLTQAGQGMGSLAYLPPEQVNAAAEVCPRADVYGLGALLTKALTGRPPYAVREYPELLEALAEPPPRLEGCPGDVADLVAEMLAHQPGRRPDARAVHERLSELRARLTPDDSGEGLFAPLVRADDGTVDAVTLAGESTEAFVLPSSSETQLEVGTRLGQYRLLELLGRGAMGQVFRAMDAERDEVVALKVLDPKAGDDFVSLQRFRREARLLTEAGNPYVANLVGVGEDAGRHFFAIEFVEGGSLAEFITKQGPTDELEALRLVADVARGLSDAHRLGIVHRDIKPANLLLADCPDTLGGCRVKVCDFGIGRRLAAQTYDLTQTGAILGTPAYLSPEQIKGGVELSPASDVYAMGVTLFELLCGRPPFRAVGTIHTLLSKHLFEPPPRVSNLRPKVSEATCNLVHRALSKHPEARFADAGELLEAIEEILSGEPRALPEHPARPDLAGEDVKAYVLEVDLEASPEALWPHVSNTERLNRALGLPDVAFSEEGEAGARRTVARATQAGFELVWREHPYEWVEGQRMGVLREFSKGPLKWYSSSVSLSPKPGGGTQLVHTIRLEARGVFSGLVAAVEVGYKSRRALERIYRRIDAAVSGRLVEADPFEEAHSMSGAQRQRLDVALERLASSGCASEVVEAFAEFVAHAPPQQVARVRPLAFAERRGLTAEATLEGFLRGARHGLFVLMWDVLCPVCRIPSEVSESLRALEEHGRCEVCDLDFELDFADSIELIFRVDSALRSSELRTYCIGGPAHSPHVCAQLRLAPGEHLELALRLEEGAYRLRSPQLARQYDLRVLPQATSRRLHLRFGEEQRGGAGGEEPLRLAAERQQLQLVNPYDRPLLVRLERQAPREDALTAARAAATPLFRELFPHEVLAPGRLIALSTVTLLVADLSAAGERYEAQGDAAAFTEIHGALERIREVVAEEGGGVVRVIGDGLLASFRQPLSALRAGLRLQRGAPQGVVRELGLRVALNTGPVLVTTIHGDLEYFGSAISLVRALADVAKPGDLALAESTATAPGVHELWEARGYTAGALLVERRVLPPAPCVRLIARARDRA